MCTLPIPAGMSLEYVSPMRSIFSRIKIVVGSLRHLFIYKIRDFATFAIIFAKTVKCPCIIYLVLPDRIATAKLNFTNINLFFVFKYFVC